MNQVSNESENFTRWIIDLLERLNEGFELVEHLFRNVKIPKSGRNVEGCRPRIFGLKKVSNMKKIFSGTMPLTLNTV